MRSALRLCLTSGLLLALMAHCGRAQESAPAGHKSSLNGILDQLWAFIGGSVRTAAQSVVTGLDGRLGEVETQLTTGFSAISNQLGDLGAKLEAQESALSEQNSSLASRLEDTRAELSTQSGQLASRLEDTRAELSTQSGQLASRLDSVLAELSSVRAARPARDCSDLPADARSGVHLVRPGLERPVAALCDLDTAGGGGGWTVIQRRDDIQPRQDFFLGWQDYKWGLGRLDGEFWWGLEHLWLMTYQLDRQYELRVDLEDFDGQKRHAVYQGFRISSEADGYRLTAVNYTGDAGDSLREHSGMRFSTKDRDHDTNGGGSCAQSYKGAWWYTKCHSSNLNGLYLAGKHDSYANGVDWKGWRGYHYSLKTVTMKIRPTKKL